MDLVALKSENNASWALYKLGLFIIFWNGYQ